MRFDYQHRTTGIALLFLLMAALTCVAGGDAEKTKKLIEVLKSDADVFSKARACQQAGEFGTAEAVPALSALLSDEKLAAYARSGLENIPDPAASAALRTALGLLEGARLAGVVTSLGVLRDAQAVEALQKLATDPAKGVVKEALFSLGRIADAASMETLRSMLRSGPETSRSDAASACLLAAERQWKLGQTECAKALYDEVRVAKVPASYRSGATRGAILMRKEQGLAFLIEQVKSADPVAQQAACQTAREFPVKTVTAALVAALNSASTHEQVCLRAAMDVVSFTPLFNGKTFFGWEGDTTNSFHIAEGSIVGGNLQNKIPRNEFLATTRFFTNFILRAECKILGPCNAGIQFRTQRIPNHHEVKGFQADMSVGKDGGYWGKLYDESRRNRILGVSENRAQMIERLKADDWNQYEIRCEGPRIQLFVNGVRTLDYTETDSAIPQFGIIAVQIHAGLPSEAWYRNISIAELP
ncbi:MAG: family 16 glycoside hydrolase [bacterium]